jgi:hypothetical protein
MADRFPDFASASLPRHLLRGGLGLGSLAASVLLLPVTGPVSLLLAPVGLLALRGCPMCWIVGLVQTVSRGRLRRSCDDGGSCELVRPGRAESVTAPAPVTGDRPEPPVPAAAGTAPGHPDGA